MKRIVLAALLVLTFAVPLVRAEPVSKVVMLLPTADETAPGWTASGCVSQFDCLNENPPHDVDSTYITANPPSPGSVISSFQLDNVPSDVDSIEGVIVFVWFRQAVSVPIYGMSPLLMEDDTACAPILESPTAAYTNLTAEYTVDCGGINVWTAETVNALRLFLSCEDDGAPPAESDCWATSAGIVVAYTTTEGSMTEREWDARLAFTVFALLLLVGVFGKRPVFVFLAGITGTFLAFSALLITGQVWSLVLFITLGPLLMLVAGFDMLMGREAKR